MKSHSLYTWSLITLLGCLLVACGNNIDSKDSGYQPAAPAERTVQPLNANWLFLYGADAAASKVDFDDSGFEPVDVPHVWAVEQGEDGGNNYPRGTGYYRKTVNIAPEHADSRVFIEFEAGSTFTEIYVNGQSVGEHRGAFSAFRFDITDHVSFGADNLIAVRADNSLTDEVAPVGGDFTVYGGIHRDVQLIIVDPVHIDLMAHGGPGVYLTSNVDSGTADIEIRAEIVNDSSTRFSGDVSARVLDADGNVVAELSQQIQNLAIGKRAAFLQTAEIAKPHLWHGRRDPYLYQVTVELKRGGAAIDSVTQPLGIRTVAVDPVDGFFLNGEPYKLNGVAMHHSRLGQGWVMDADDLRQDYEIMAEMGVTAVRMSHYPHSKAAYEMADEFGMVVWTEIPLVNGVRLNQAFDDNAETQLLEMIHQNYNHPSVALWGLFNEITIESSEAEAAALLAKLRTLALEQDSNRPLAGATALLGRTADSGSPTNDTIDLTAFNTYFGWYYQEFEDFGIWADENHSNYTNIPMAISEYGAGAGPNLHSDNPNRSDHSEEYQMLFHEAYLKQLQQRDYLWGSFLWVMFDFSSDARNEGEAPGVNDKGLVTGERQLRKDAYYLYQANWTEQPMLHLASKRFNPRRSDMTDIKVYSNLPQVSLTLNNQVIGSQQVVDGKAVFANTALILGDNLVEVSAQSGAEILTDSVTWNRQLSDDSRLNSTRLGIRGPLDYFSDDLAHLNDPYGKIINLPYRSRFGELEALLQPAPGTTLSLVDTAGNPTPSVNDAYIIQGTERLRVVAEDGVAQVDYEFADGPISLNKYVDVNKELPPMRGRYAANDGRVDRGQYLMWFSFGGSGWWKVHLGDNYYIDSVDVVWPTGKPTADGDSATQYLLEVSDTDLVFGAYETVVDASDNTIKAETSDAMGVTGRFLRLRVLDTTVVFDTTAIQASGALEVSVIGGYIFSDQVTIDYVNRTIGGAVGRSVAAVLTDLQTAGSATVRIEDGNGNVQASGTVDNTMVVVASSADGLLREAYTLL